MPLIGLIVTIVSFFFIDTQWVKFTLGGIGIASFLLAGYLFLVVFRHWKKQTPDAPFIQFFRSLVYDAENLSEVSGMIPKDFDARINDRPNEVIKNATDTENAGYEKFLKLRSDHLELLRPKFRIVRVFYCFEQLDEPMPYINFGIDLCNDTVFEIVIEKVEGYIEFEDRRLKGEITAFDKPVKIAPMTSYASITISQFITETEKPALLAARQSLRGANFRVSNLEISFKGGENAPEIKFRKLEIHREYAEESEIREIVELREEIVRLRREHKAEAESLTEFTDNRIKKIQADWDADVKQRDKYIEKFDFVISPISEQRDHIGKFVDLEKMFLLGPDNSTVPTLRFMVSIHNRSFFELELVLPMQGYISLIVPPEGQLGWNARNTHRFEKTPRFTSTKHRKIGACDTSAFDFELRITKEEQEHIENWKKNRPDLKFENYLRFEHLEINFKGVKDVYGVNATRLPISRNVFAIEYGDYVIKMARFEYADEE